jgi:hypothetical protein
VNNPLDIEKKTIIIALKFDLLFRAFFPLVAWDFSSAWIGA